MSTFFGDHVYFLGWGGRFWCRIETIVGGQFFPWVGIVLVPTTTLKVVLIPAVSGDHREAVEICTPIVPTAAPLQGLLLPEMRILRDLWLCECWRRRIRQHDS